MKQIVKSSIILVFVFITGSSLLASPILRIAAAANTKGIIAKLQADFKKRTGISSEAIIGSSGKLSAQIMSGAPYDVFLSADTEFPDQLHHDGFSQIMPRVYAIGSLIISANFDFKTLGWRRAIASIQARTVAIANPKTAPYGRAAQQALNFYALLDKISGKMVYAESISQVNTYLHIGSVEMAFTTEAILYEQKSHSKINWARIPQESYSPIEQKAILMGRKGEKISREAMQFYQYLFSEPARSIIKSNGYYLPKR